MSKKHVAGYVAFAIFLFADAAFASSATLGGGTGIQWETPIRTLVNSITGPVAFAFVVLALVGLGVKLVKGDDMGQFGHYALNFVIAGSTIMFAIPLVSGVMFSGAALPDVETLEAIFQAAQK